jgi:hypothetical protein
MHDQTQEYGHRSTIAVHTDPFHHRHPVLERELRSVAAIRNLTSRTESDSAVGSMADWRLDLIDHWDETPCNH